MQKIRIISIISVIMMLNTALWAQTAGKAAEGWISLFNGKTLDGWTASENKDCFTVADGAIIAHGKRSHLFYTGPVQHASFKNFIFRAEVMTKPGSNGGLYFHTSYQATDWPAKGFEVQVNNSFKPDWRKTGGLYRILDTPVALVRDNEWFTEQITVIGKHVITQVNGRTVVDWTEPDNFQPPAGMPGRKLDRGTFALQGHDPGSTVYYKNIYVKPLPDNLTDVTAKKGWVTLFDGKTLAGWHQLNGKAHYEVVDGTIKGTTAENSPNSFLCTKKTYTDFELEFEVLLDRRLNSGVQIRSNSMPEYRNGRVHGYQVEIATNGNAGFIYDEARRGWLSKDRSDKLARGAFKDGQWNKYRVVCIGDTIRTWINGIPIAEVVDSMTHRGFIGLQVHHFVGKTPAWVRWRNLRIKELTPTQVKPVNVVVVTGGHGFEHEPFYRIFNNLAHVTWTEAVQKDDSELFEDITSWNYDVIVFYNLTQKISTKRQQNFISLLERGVGVVALHHTLGAYQQWPVFKQIIGGKYYLQAATEKGTHHKASSYKHGCELHITVMDKNHPVTRDMADFDINDETYKNVWHAPDNYVLLTCDNPLNDKEIGWTRIYKNARICTIQLGHDSHVFNDANYNKLIANAIWWAAQR